MFYLGFGVKPRFIFPRRNIASQSPCFWYHMDFHRAFMKPSWTCADRIKLASERHILAFPSLRDSLLVWEYFIFPAETLVQKHCGEGGRDGNKIIPPNAFNPCHGAKRCSLLSFGTSLCFLKTASSLSLISRCISLWKYFHQTGAEIWV